MLAVSERDTFGQHLGTAIRYAATLMIYISSTADMLMSEIGKARLWGPVLFDRVSADGDVATSSCGQTVFCILDTIFVFARRDEYGVARRSSDRCRCGVGWVFGIMSGLILLSALAGMRNTLRQVATVGRELARWE